MALPRMWGPKPKYYDCERCGKHFFSRAALRYHFKAKHLMNIRCEICEKDLPVDSHEDHAMVPLQVNCQSFSTLGCGAHPRLQAFRASVVQRHFRGHGASMTIGRGARNAVTFPTKIDHENILTGDPGRCWIVTPKRETRFMVTETIITCRMCAKQYATVQAREHHEKQEHQFTANKRAQMSTGFKPDNILDYTKPEEIERFVETKLRPISGSEKLACVSEVDGIIALIKEVFPLPVVQVVKGGSYIKGTDSRDGSDLDVVLFSDAFESLDDCKKKIPEVLEELRNRLIKSSFANRIIMQKRTPFSLRFYFNCYKDLHGHSFDVMPCYDMVGPTLSMGLKKSFYQKLYLCNDNDTIQLYSMVLLKYQVDFVKSSPERVKDLIRLVKHWFKTSFAKSTAENKFRRLPSSYTLELITIYIWELAGKPTFFSFVQGMRAILKFLVQYQNICIIWHKYYSPNFKIFKQMIMKHSRPLILDPVNPTFNVCENSNAWDEVTHVVQRSLLKPLFNGVKAQKPWLFTNNW